MSVPASLIGRLKLQTNVLVTVKDKFTNKPGVVKYVGKIDNKKDQFIGIELETPDGTHDGTVEGKRYFQTKQMHGGLFRPTSVTLADGTPVDKIPAQAPPAKGTVKKTGLAPPAQTKRPAVATISGIKSPKAKPGLPAQSVMTPDHTEDIEMDDEVLLAVKAELEAARVRIAELEAANQVSSGDGPAKQLAELKTKNRHAEQTITKLKKECEQLKTLGSAHSSSNSKEKEDFNQKLNFFQSQKESMEKEKTQLKKTIARLQTEMEEQEGKDDMLEKLTYKVTTLEEKNTKLREQLEITVTELKNAKLFSAEGSIEGSPQKKANEPGDYEENIRTLTQLNSLLESDLQEAKEQVESLNKELTTMTPKIQQLNKLERRLKTKQEEVECLKLEVETFSDAAAFVEKLTLDSLKKEELNKELTDKTTQQKKELETHQATLADQRELIELQKESIDQMEAEQEKLRKDLEEHIEHISELNKQIAKYKSKLTQMGSPANEVSLLNTSVSMLNVEPDVSVVSHNAIGSNQYQQKYFAALKQLNVVQQRYTNYASSMSSLRVQVGVSTLNLLECVPESFHARFYPEVISKVARFRSINDRLYVLFGLICQQLIDREDIYAEQTCDCCLMILEQTGMVYPTLAKLEQNLIVAQTQKDLEQVLAFSLDESLGIVEAAIGELITKASSQSLEMSFTQGQMKKMLNALQTLDKVVFELKPLPSLVLKRIELCETTMGFLHIAFKSIMIYKRSSDLDVDAQVDSLLEGFLRGMLTYLQEACTNPALRYKAQMKQFTEGTQLLRQILESMREDGLLVHLGNIHIQDIEEVKMMRQTLQSVQFHIKQLLLDLKDIQFKSQADSLRVTLSGAVWTNRIAKIKAEFSNIEELKAQKEETNKTITDLKVKIAVLERNLQDKTSVKELYEKRLGQLQLKVEASSSLEAELKRTTEKLKTIEKEFEIATQEVTHGNQRRKQLEDELRKIKERYDSLQTENMMRNKKNRASFSASADQLESLAIFKNLTEERNNLKALDTKRKLLNLLYSPIMEGYTIDHEGKVVAPPAKPEIGRSSQFAAMKLLSSLEIVDPRTQIDKTQIVIDQARRMLTNPEQGTKQDRKVNQRVKVGSITIRCQTSAAARVDQGPSRQLIGY